MLWLLYGSYGWIGNQLSDLLISMGETIIRGQSRLNNYNETMEEINKIGPDRIICTIGRTSGPNHPNIDYLELPGKLIENLRDNLHGPINLAIICQILKIHMTYLGTGCIYEYDSNHPMDNFGIKGFTETDIPNFNGSQYSVVKGVTDQLIRQYPILNARIRMPISSDVNPRNFITKITQYKKVISIPNSMTVLDELLPKLIYMAKSGYIGNFNLTNPGVISHAEILDMYKEYVDNDFNYELMSLEELDNHIIGKRSNNYLDTEKLCLFNPEGINPIKLAVRLVLIEMKKKMDINKQTVN